LRKKNNMDKESELFLKDLQAILAFLPAFKAEDFSFGEWKTPEEQAPYFEFSPQAKDFIKAAQPLLASFDWIGWQDSAEEILNDPERLACADLLTLRKLLTTHIRMDRFVAGHLDALHQDGHLTALLEQMKEAQHNPQSVANFKVPPPLYQTLVARFVAQHNLSADLETRLLDLLSEMGEVAKEALKSTNYGQNPFLPSEEWENELGDLFFSLICIANSTGVDLDTALEKALDKYSQRLEDTDTPSSGK
jgi:NTP pyrophosphatase (non-canonical NTP hydrolase)